MTEATDAPDGAGQASVERDLRASVPRSVLVGFAVMVSLAATVFFLVAIPFYTLASFEPNGIDRPIVRTGLFRIALPVGALVGVVGGVVAGRWARAGRRWRVDDGGDRYSTRTPSR